MRTAMTRPVPPILDNDLLEAVSSLVRAADPYRSVLFLVAEENRQVMTTILKHEELLNLCDRVINGWRKQLGQDVEEDDDPIA
jgi:hypothetical protein